jgi:single-strand DNA-binding protein
MLNNLNSVLIEGNLTEDVKMEHTPKGTPYCRFVISSVRNFKEGDTGFEEGDNPHQTYFIPIVTYGGLAYICEREGSKRRGLRVVGGFRTKTTHLSKGIVIQELYVIAEHVESRPIFSKKPAEE